MAARFADNVLERNPFAIDLFDFLWRVLGHAQGEITNPVKSFFNDDIGFSVLYIQSMYRGTLMTLLNRIPVRTTEHAIQVTRKLCRERRRNDECPVASKVFLDCCAIIAEVYLYYNSEIDISIESSMVFISWNLVFTQRRISELLSNGGWEEVTAYAVNEYHGKINFNYQLKYVEYPKEIFIMNQTYDEETHMVVEKFQEYFKDFVKTRAVKIARREQYRPQKSGKRKKREKDRLIAKPGTAHAESIMAAQYRKAMRSTSRSTDLVEWSDYIPQYVTSDEDCNEDASPSVTELCTKMSGVQIAGDKKKPKREKKASHKATETEGGSESSAGPSIEPVSPATASISETLTLSSRPLEVPSRKPETSPTSFVETVHERNPFAIDLFNFLWRVLDHAQGQITNSVESFFNNYIGFSVLYIQYMTRGSLRSLLEEIRIRTTEDAIHVTRKLCRERRRNDKCSVASMVFLECCAIIAEVYLYCKCEINIQIESSMVFISWNLVFTQRRISELLSNGGWEEVTAYAFSKYYGKITLNYELEHAEYPNESFITNQIHDYETDMMAAKFKEYFVDFVEKRAMDVVLREQQRQQKSALRMKRKNDRLIAEPGTAYAQSIMAAQNRMAKRFARVKWTDYTPQYVTSDEDCNEDDSPSVTEMCTNTYGVQFAFGKKKKPKRKKKPSHKATETEKGSESSAGPSIKPVSPEKASISETLTSSARPLKVPSRKPETSPTKSETKVTSPKQSQTGKKGEEKA